MNNELEDDLLLREGEVAWLGKSARVHQTAQERRCMVEQEQVELHQEALYLPGGVGQGRGSRYAAWFSHEALNEGRLIPCACSIDFVSCRGCLIRKEKESMHNRTNAI